ncbi:MAG TPA: pyridoxal phosphate-dependent aminotransferase [Edaphobacter sp.]|nr:pyridoxal phosphate-dependent aminotransferase [Edaphobacter sp.]
MSLRPRFAASLIRQLADGAMGQENLLPFWFGESDQATPMFIREAAMASLREGETFYTENLGRRYLRGAVARYLTGLHGRPIGVGRTAMTTSGDSALMLASQLLVSPGDRVVIVTPLWPNAIEIPKVAGGKVECVSLEVMDGRWGLPLEKLLEALTPATRMLVINSPNNPTGWTIGREEQQAIFEHCRRLGIWIVADDVYERLVYDESLKSAPSFLTLAEDEDRLIVVNSFSKAWTMTGWRVGWMVTPASVVGELSSLIEYNTSCIAEFVQRGAAAAVEQGEAYVVEQRTRLGETQRRLLAALRELPGVEVPESSAAMYVFLRVEGESDSMQLARRLVDEVGLGLAPGRAFGPEGEGWMRWCFASAWAKNECGVERFGRFLAKRK